MVMLRATEPVTYELYDERGQALGQVVLPREAVIVGPQAGTVLLQRDLHRIRLRVVKAEVRPQAA